MTSTGLEEFYQWDHREKPEELKVLDDQGLDQTFEYHNVFSRF